MREIEHIGEKFNKLTIIGLDVEKYNSDTERLRRGEIKQITKNCICKCDCGNMKSMRYQNVIKKKYIGCGKCRDIKFKESIGDFIVNNYGESTLHNAWSKTNTVNAFDVGSGAVAIKVKFICEKCGFEYELTPLNYKNGNRCPCCAGKVVIKGINDIATTHSHLVKYFDDIEDSYRFNYRNKKFANMICPTCGEKIKYDIRNLCSSGFNCHTCGDGVSYPNKFMHSLLNNIHVNFEEEKKFKWSINKRYDIYIESISTIIENHGGQHYVKNTGMFSQHNNSIKENDRLKRELAINNGINEYIEIDCSRSEVEWIKQSIMGSKLPEILKFTENDVDWVECGINASKNLLQDVVDMAYNNTTAEIASHINTSTTTVLFYVHRAIDLNLLDYNYLRGIGRVK